VNALSTTWRCATLLAIAATGLLAAPAMAQSVPSFAGIWLIEGDHATIRTVDGKLPPMKTEARKRYDAAVKARKAGKPINDTLTSCLPHGLPRLMFAPYPIEILQEPKQLSLLHEAHHMPHLIYIGDKLPPNDKLDGNYMGFSAARWEGDTLVVDSGGFNDITTIDTAGVPHSDEMVLNERLRLLDKGQVLEDEITVTDPATFTSAWKTRITFKRQDPSYWLKEQVCTDKNPGA
jgi:hypothetical protein